VTFDGDLKEAHAPLSVTLVLNKELDISRGDLIVAENTPAKLAQDFKAALVWMDQQPLDRSRRYLLKHASQTVPVVISALEYRTDIRTLAHEPVSALEMNAIGLVNLHLLRPMAIDRYAEVRGTGSFILIDPETNRTVAAGMVVEALDRVRAEKPTATAGPVTEEERIKRWGHRGGVLALAGPADTIDRIERGLFLSGAVTLRTSNAESLGQLVEAGILILVVTIDEGATLRAATGAVELTISASDPVEAVASTYRLLAQAGIRSLRDAEDIS
jgi:sulfate adenylyltransferase subunit 1